MDLHRSSALVGFYGDNLDPDELTVLLGAEPTVGVSKGGIWLTSMGAEKVAPTGSWRLVAEACEPADLNGQIDGLLSSLTSDLSVWRRLAEQFRAVVLCALRLNFWNEGLEIAPKTLAALADRGLILDLDIYCPDDPTE